MSDPLEAIGRLTRQGQPIGTAFIVHETGLVATACHVLEVSSKLSCTSGTAFTFELLNGHLPLRAVSTELYDPQTDVALLQLEDPLPAGIAPVQLVRSSALRPGMRWHTRGYGKLEDPAYSYEHLSALGEVVGTVRRSVGSYPGRTNIDMIHLRSDNILQGMSGAPVIVPQTGGVSAIVSARYVARPDESYGRHTIFASKIESLVALDARLKVVNPLPTAPFREHLKDFSSQLGSVERYFGHEEIFTALQKYAQALPCAYVRITGEAGLGKTALATEIVKRYDAPCFFFDRSDNLRSADQFVRHLWADLTLRFGLLDDGVAPGGSKIEDSNFLFDIFNRAADRSGTPLWIVVDAVDEAENSAHDGNVGHLPSRLPRNVFVVITARPGRYRLEVKPDTPVRNILLSQEHEAQTSAVTTYLKHRLNQPDFATALDIAGASTKKSELIRQLVRSSEGNFMYLTYALHEIIADPAMISLKNWPVLPVGLQGYYSAVWDRLGSYVRRDGSTDGGTNHREVIALLCVAAEPVTLDWIALHANLQVEHIRDVVLPFWRQFLAERREAGTLVWRPVHRSLVEFVGTKVSLASFHASIGRRYLGHPNTWHLDNHYAFQHATQHLARASAIDELFLLVRNIRWYREQRSVDPTLGDYYRDLDNSWRALHAQAGDLAWARRLGDACWLALATASLASIAALARPDILLACVRTGLSSAGQVLSLARERLPPPMICLLMLELLDTADAKAHESIADEILNIAASIPDADLSQWLFESISRRLSGDMLGRMWDSIPAIPLHRRLAVLVGLAKSAPSHLRAGIMAEAIRILPNVDDEHRAAGLIRIAKATSGDQQVDLLEQFVASVSLSESSIADHHELDLAVEALPLIGGERRERIAGYILNAIRNRSPSLVYQVEGWPTPDDTLAKVAKSLPEALLPDALEIAGNAQNPLSLYHDLQALAPRLSGDLVDRATEILKLQPKNTGRAETAFALMSNGKTSKVQHAELVGLLDPEHTIWLIIRGFATVWEDMPQPDRQKVFKELAGHLRKFSAREAIEVFEGQASTLPSDLRRAVVAQMREIAGRSESDETVRYAFSKVLAEFAITEARGEYRDELVRDAFESARMLPREHFVLGLPRQMALSRLSTHLSREQVATALEVLQGDDDRGLAVLMLATLADYSSAGARLRVATKALSKARSVDASVAWAWMAGRTCRYRPLEISDATLRLDSFYGASAVRGAWQRVEATASLLRHLADGDRRQALREAVVVAQKISDREDRSSALASLATAVAEFEGTWAALSLVSKCQNSETQALALVQLAPSLTYWWEVERFVSLSMRLEASFNRALALVSVLSHVGGRKRRHLVDVVLDSLTQAQQDAPEKLSHAEVLVPLLPHLSSRQSDVAIEFVEKHGRYADRAAVLVAVASSRAGAERADLLRNAARLAASEEDRFAKVAALLRASKVSERQKSDFVSEAYLAAKQPPAYEGNMFRLTDQALSLAVVARELAGAERTDCCRRILVALRDFEPIRKPLPVHYLAEMAYHSARVAMDPLPAHEAGSFVLSMLQAAAGKGMDFVLLLLSQLAPIEARLGGTAGIDEACTAVLTRTAETRATY